MREPLLLPAAALATGILGAHFYFFHLPDLALPALLCSLTLTLAFSFQSARRMRLAIVCTLLALAGAATQVVHRQAKAPRLNAEDADTVLLSGCVVDPPVFSPDRGQFTLQLAPNANARLSVNLKDNASLPLSYGQKVEAAAKIRSPRNFGNPESFDYVSYLAAQHIYWSGSVSSPSEIQTEPGRCGWRPLALLFGVRSWALERLTNLYPGDHQTAALLQATLLGQTNGVERRWTNDFRVTGTYHALVISGQHISVLAVSLLFLLRILQFSRIRALGVATVACWFYALLSGFTAPVVRAAGGFTLFFLASYFFRRTRILNTLAVVGIAYLAFDPDGLFDPSFQLSFLSAAAVAVFAIPCMNRFTKPLRASLTRFDQPSFDPRLEPRAAQWRVELRLLAETLGMWTGFSPKVSNRVVILGARLAEFVADAVIVSACVQFGLALPMIAYFHRFSISGLSANIVVVPLLSVVVPLGFASILTGWNALALATKFFLLAAEWVAGGHAHVEPSWRFGALPLWISLLFSVSLVLLACSIRGRRRFLPVALAGSLAVFAVLCWQPWKPDLHPNELEVSAIDVSQGDSLFVAFPDGETMLVDAGGFPGAERMTRKPNLDMGEDVVSPYLWSRRIRHLDYVVLTHGHSDHMGGLPAILDNFHPSILWIGAEPDSAAWRLVEQHAAADHVRIVALTRSSPARLLGGTQMRVFAPAPGYMPGETAGNNDSLVFELQYGRRSVLFTGDAERPVEHDMVESGALSTVTLLKVGHHGSKTSSSEELLAAVNPSVAFISDGYKNQFHHPHPTVLDRLAEHHVAVFRTDQQGLLTFLTDGKNFEVLPYR